MCDDKIPEIYDRRTEKCPETIQENFISLKEGMSVITCCLAA